MDYYNQPNQSDNNQQHGGPGSFSPQAGVGMASAALFLGAGAFFTLMTVFLPLAFGGLAIVFALLSKGYGRKMLIQARVGLICGIGALCVTVTLVVSSVVMLLNNPSLLTQIGQQYDNACEEIYGQPSEEIFGFSFEDMMEEYTDTIE